MDEGVARPGQQWAVSHVHWLGRGTQIPGLTPVQRLQ